MKFNVFIEQKTLYLITPRSYSSDIIFIKLTFSLFDLENNVFHVGYIFKSA